MSEETAISLKTDEVSDKPWLWNPGQSGNPLGRPKNTLKDYVRRKLDGLTDEEKDKWLKEHKITGIDQWKMAEGLPQQDLDIKGEIQTKIISIDE